MKKTRLLLVTLLACGAISLSSCAKLFNDDDISYSNSYNQMSSYNSSAHSAEIMAGGVEGKRVEAVNQAYCFKNIKYGNEDGKIINTYKTGGVNHKEFNVNMGADYDSAKYGNNYDLYVPDVTPRNDKHVVILFIHGGAWISGFKTDVNDYVHEFANRGYITATVNYTLLNKEMNNPSLSIFRDLDEIDACITSIKSVLEELGFDTTKSNLVIGGASSGAHLAMLYSYSRGERSALPIRFIVDAVGPVDIKPSAWKAFVNPSDEVLEAGITYSAISTQIASDNLKKLKVSGEGYDWNDYQTMRIANGMCGLPYSLENVEAATDENKVDITNPNDASNAMLKADGGEDVLSVTYWMSSTNLYPMICAYAGKDSIVGINQFATLENALITYGGTYEYFYFKNSDHKDITPQADEAKYNAFLDKVDDWCKAI